MTRKWVWTSIAITAMWAAVLFASVFGGDIVVQSAAGDRVTTPMGVVVAAFAVVPTIVAAVVGLRDGEEGEARREPEATREERRTPAASH
ncbi:MAG TPA: hypothetical protein VK915_11665 [Gaiellaceae bacterium]|nr:hypothetical protein [Gaiellaceae bacterium]